MAGRLVSVSVKFTLTETNRSPSHCELSSYLRQNLYQCPVQSKLFDEFEINRPIHANDECMRMYSFSDTPIIWVFESKLEGDDVGHCHHGEEGNNTQTVIKVYYTRRTNHMQNENWNWRSKVFEPSLTLAICRRRQRWANKTNQNYESEWKSYINAWCLLKHFPSIRFVTSSSICDLFLWIQKGECLKRIQIIARYNDLENWWSEKKMRGIYQSAASIVWPRKPN